MTKKSRTEQEVIRQQKTVNNERQQPYPPVSSSFRFPVILIATTFSESIDFLSIYCIIYLIICSRKTAAGNNRKEPPAAEMHCSGTKV